MTTDSAHYWSNALRVWKLRADLAIAMDKEDPLLQDSDEWITPLAQPQRIQEDAKLLLQEHLRRAASDVASHWRNVDSPENDKFWTAEIEQMIRIPVSLHLWESAWRAAEQMDPGARAEVIRTWHTVEDSDEWPPALRVLKVCREMKDVSATASTVASERTPTSADNESATGESPNSAPYIQRVQAVSPPEFHINDIPEQEKRKRLARGEIAPREEWIPSNDKTNLKTIGTGEVNVRLQFSEKLLSEARQKVDQKKHLDACTLYAQGITLLEWYTSDDLQERLSLAQCLAKFRRNKATIDLKLENYRDVIGTCKDVLETDEHDGKARYLMGRAYFLLGCSEEAKAEFQFLAEDGFASEEHRAAGRAGLKQLAKQLRQNRMSMKKVMDQMEFKSEESAYPTSKLPQSLQNISARSVGQAAKSKIESSSFLNSSPLPMALERFTELLQEMLRAYTRPSVVKWLEKAREDADFDETKIIIKLRKMLPEVLAPIFERYEEIPGSSYEEKKKCFDSYLLLFKGSSQISPEERKNIRDLVVNMRTALMDHEEVLG